jgi:hypothetical protein
MRHLKENLHFKKTFIKQVEIESFEIELDKDAKSYHCLIGDYLLHIPRKNIITIFPKELFDALFQSGNNF